MMDRLVRAMLQAAEALIYLSTAWPSSARAHRKMREDGCSQQTLSQHCRFLSTTLMRFSRKLFHVTVKAIVVECIYLSPLLNNKKKTLLFGNAMHSVHAHLKTLSIFQQVLDLSPQLALTPSGFAICSHFESSVECEMEVQMRN